MNTDELELMPKWLPPLEREKNISSEFGKWFGLTLIVIMTMGLILCFDYLDGTTNTKGEK